MDPDTCIHTHGEGLWAKLRETDKFNMVGSADQDKTASKYCLATYQLCELGQVPGPLFCHLLSGDTGHNTAEDFCRDEMR